MKLAYNRLAAQYAQSAILQLIGYGLLWWQVGFLPALGVFFVHFGINIERRADRLRQLLENKIGD